jgi:hypothetical protein
MTKDDLIVDMDLLKFEQLNEWTVVRKKYKELNREKSD